MSKPIISLHEFEKRYFPSLHRKKKEAAERWIDHLDNCKHCNRDPFNPCLVGQSLVRELNEVRDKVESKYRWLVEGETRNAENDNNGCSSN